MKKWDVIDHNGNIIGGVEEVDHNEAIMLAFEIYGIDRVFDVKEHKKGS